MPHFGSGIVELIFLFLVSFLIPTFNFISPFRPIIVIIGLATHLPPLIVGIVASIGSALGALPLYYIGKKLQSLEKVQVWLDKRPSWKRLIDKVSHSSFLVIQLLLWLPFPDQLVGLYGGFERYPIWKFLIANLIGRAVWYIPLAYFGSDIVDWLWAIWHWLQRIF